MNDPWRNRSMTMRCTTCIWYVPKVHADAKAGDQVRLGRCRRHAPTMNGYPAVFPTDWCGDHKLNENAIAPAQSITQKAEDSDGS